MPVVKRFVCLANSYKPGGRCIAGRELPRGAWIRPIGADPGEALTSVERQYANGGEPQLLDVMEVPLGVARPSGCQQENWTIQRGVRWQRSGTFPFARLRELEEPLGPLWVNGHDTYHGKNDEIPASQGSQIASSLRLIHVDQLDVLVFRKEYEGQVSRKVLGRFRHAGEQYRLSVTDPRFDATAYGEFVVHGCYLTISISLPFKKGGACYKLIAAVIDRAGELCA